MAPHSSTLAWKIPWTEEAGRLQSMGSLRVGHDSMTSLSLFTFMHWRRKWQPNSSVLAWRIPEMGEPGGLPSLGLHRVGHDWSYLAAAAVAGSTCFLIFYLFLFMWFLKLFFNWRLIVSQCCVDFCCMISLLFYISEYKLSILNIHRFS